MDRLAASWDVFGRFWCRLETDLARLAGVLRHLEPSGVPIGGVSERLGRILGGLWAFWRPTPNESQGNPLAICFLEASWGRLVLIVGSFLDGFWDDCSIIFSSYP